jgi:hypothetical protein
MIVIAFVLFAALVLAWLRAPGKQSTPRQAPSRVIQGSEALA